MGWSRGAWGNGAGGNGGGFRIPFGWANIGCRMEALLWRRAGTVSVESLVH